MVRKRKKFPKDPHENKAIYFDRKILNSKVYWDLTGISAKYLMVFLGRRQMHPVKSDGTWIIGNNGQITFTYKDAANYYGVKNPGTHLRNLKKLHELGFIDINHLGGGMDGDCSTFYISRRWKQYGTPDFVKKEWPKDTRKKGNPKIRNYGKGRT